MNNINLAPEKVFTEKSNSDGPTDENTTPMKNLGGPTAVAVIGLVTTGLPLILPLITDLAKTKGKNSQCLIAIKNYTNYGIEHHSLISPRGKHLVAELPTVPPQLKGGAPMPYVFEQSFGISNYNTILFRAPACLAQWKILCTPPIYLFGFVWMARWNDDNAGFFKLSATPVDLALYWADAKPGVDYFDCGLIGSKCDRAYEEWGLKLDGSLSNDNPGTFELVLSEVK